MEGLPERRQWHWWCQEEARVIILADATVHATTVLASQVMDAYERRIAQLEELLRSEG